MGEQADGEVKDVEYLSMFCFRVRPESRHDGLQINRDLFNRIEQV